MRKELTDQIRACSVLYGAQFEDEDIQKLQEIIQEKLLKKQDLN